MGSWQVVVGQVAVSPSSSVGRTRWLGTGFIARVAVRTRLPALGSRPFAEARVGVQLLLVFPALIATTNVVSPSAHGLIDD